MKVGAVSLKCERGVDGKSYAVFHHDTEAEVNVTGYGDAAGAYQKQFVYNKSMETMLFVINNSASCQQHTKAVCKRLKFVSRGFTWLNGRNNKTLLYWGGGPSDDKGCSCGITHSCANPRYKCNCDINNTNSSSWYTDEGFVTLRSDLPLTGIAVGDTAYNNGEVLRYTIGSLRCVF